MSVSTAERNATKAEAHIVQLADDIKQAEDQLRRDNDVRAQADADSVELTKSIEAAVAALAAAGSDTSATKRAIAALQKREADGQMVRLELAAQLQTAEKKMAEVADSLPHWRNKLRPLKLNVIPTALAGSAEQLAKQEQDERDGILTLKTYTEEELAGYKLEDLQYAISIVEEGLRKQTPNLSVIEEFYRKRVVYQERVSVLEEITRRRTEMTKVLEEVRKKRFNEFQAGFHVISFKLREMYRMITLGGDAELELVDSMDPFLEGVTFSVRPPKKSWKNISNLSGGEKTLSSLALVFALHYYKPSPLYFLDEIDAALDFKNVSIVAHYIKVSAKTGSNWGCVVYALVFFDISTKRPAPRTPSSSSSRCARTCSICATICPASTRWRTAPRPLRFATSATRTHRSSPPASSRPRSTRSRPASQSSTIRASRSYR